uniref:RluA family pseudouridine synthase n=1 Tax=Ndongobacter massiliensis TaxID=1871025 RepID=UPI000930FC00|nr:RluA family pseudouridine synthase [Ndongobacter massiliensis]
MRLLVEADEWFEEEDGANRLDRYLSHYFPEVSRTRIAKAIRTGQIQCNEKSVKPSTLVRPGDAIQIAEDALQLAPICPEPYPLSVLYEDDTLLVVNKPPQMVTHPTSAVRTGTLVNALLARGHALSTLNGPERPGIVHRLDVDTTGALVVAKDDATHQALADQFRNRQTEKTYVALLEGVMKEREQMVEAPIGRLHHQRRMSVFEDGKVAKSRFRKIDAKEGSVLVEVDLYTGRTHQIRVHAKYVGMPVLGDALYGVKKSRFHARRPFLHAWRLRFLHPQRGYFLIVQAPIPEDFVARALACGYAQAVLAPYQKNQVVWEE